MGAGKSFCTRFTPVQNYIQAQGPRVEVLRLIYTKHQRQCCGNSAMMLAMVSLENGLQSKSGASSQRCCSIDADTQCKWALSLRGVGFQFNHCEPSMVNVWDISAECRVRPKGSARTLILLQPMYQL